MNYNMLTCYLQGESDVFWVCFDETYTVKSLRDFIMFKKRKTNRYKNIDSNDMQIWKIISDDVTLEKLKKDPRTVNGILLNDKQKVVDVFNFVNQVLCTSSNSQNVIHIFVGTPIDSPNTEKSTVLSEIRECSALVDQIKESIEQSKELIVQLHKINEKVNNIVQSGRYR